MLQKPGNLPQQPFAKQLHLFRRPHRLLKRFLLSLPFLAFPLDNRVLQQCSVSLTLDRISGRWKSLILYNLRQENLRYGQVDSWMSLHLWCIRIVTYSSFVQQIIT